jgi:hypothetical protein
MLRCTACFQVPGVSRICLYSLLYFTFTLLHRQTVLAASVIECFAGLDALKLCASSAVLHWISELSYGVVWCGHMLWAQHAPVCGFDASGCLECVFLWYAGGI